MLFIAFLRLFQSSVIRLLLHLIRSRRAFSTCFPNTAQLIGYSFMDNYCAVCFLKVFKMEKTPKPYRSTFCSSLHPLTLTMLLFHRYYYVIKLRSKDFMPKLKYNESRREGFFASGVVGLQRMSYLEKRIHF